MSLATLIKLHALKLNKCRPDDFLDDAITVLTTNKTNALAIIEGSKLVGILTDADIIRAVHANLGTAGTLDNEYVFNWMTKDVITCPYDTPLAEVLRLMAKHKIRHIVAYDEDTHGTVVVSIRDILTRLHEEDELEKNVLRDMANAASLNAVA